MSVQPETSRKMIRRALFGAAQSEEETRAYLQERVTLLFKLMFWSLIALMTFLASTYALDVTNAPLYRSYVYFAAAIGLAGMVFIWQVVLRKPVAIESLYRLDLTYSFCIGASFALSAYLQNDLVPSGYLSLIYSTFTVFSRTLIIPSTWRRTLVTSSLTYAPMTVAAAILAWQDHQDMPGPAYFIGYLLLMSAPIVLATAGSYIIYGLTQKASAAQQLGQYTLDRKIGAGGMGTVYLAHHVLLRRPTAIKLVEHVTPEALERFEREVQHMSQLTHPNSVAVFDYGHSLDGTFYYAMEYLGGGLDLDELVREHGPQPNDRVASILAQVCGALHEAHLAKLIHRDVKPANILLCERGGRPDVAKVVDYGLVKEFTADTGMSGQVVLGTPAYMAPEAMTDPANIGPAVDLYAVGAVGYFLLTGQPIFKGKTALDVCIQHVTKAVTPPSQVAAHVSPALERVIMKCLEKAPGDRFASARELETVLRELAPAKDWSPAEARRWWNNFRDRQKSSQPVDTDAPTRTMQIDLAEGRA